MLSRTLADQGHYPAIDIEASISRALTNLIDQPQFELVRRFKSLYSRQHRNRDLVAVGAYVAGTDHVLDDALALYPSMEAFLQQNMTERTGYADSVARLRATVGAQAGV